MLLSSFFLTLIQPQFSICFKYYILFSFLLLRKPCYFAIKTRAIISHLRHPGLPDLRSACQQEQPYNHPQFRHGYLSWVAVRAGRLLAVPNAHRNVPSRYRSTPTATTIIHSHRVLRQTLPFPRPPFLRPTQISRAAKTGPSVPRVCQLPRWRVHPRSSDG